MVKLQALRDCKIAFKYKDEVIKFKLKEGEIIQKVDKYIIEKLLNTNMLKLIE